MFKSLLLALLMLLGTNAIAQGTFPNTVTLSGVGPLVLVSGTHGNRVVLLDCTGGDTVTVPAASDTDFMYFLKRTNTTGDCTIDPNASETIDGATTFVLSAQFEFIWLVSDGTNWVNIDVKKLGENASWETLGNVNDTVTSYLSDDNAETVTYDYQSDFSTDRMIFKSSVGNPTGGALVKIEIHDQQVTPFQIAANTFATGVFTVDSGMNTTIDNNGDTGIDFTLVSGTTGSQTTRILFSDRGTIEWITQKDGADAYSIREAVLGINRVAFDLAGTSTYLSGAVTADHIFGNSAGTVRGRFLGDAGTICIGPAEDTCLSRNAAGVYRINPTAGATPNADGEFGYDSTADRWVFAINTVKHEVVSPSTTDIFTEKSIDPEASGNVIRKLSYIMIDAAACIGASPSLNWDDAGTGDTAPTAACNDTGSIQRPSADFAGGAVNSFERTLKLPTGTAITQMDLTIRYVTVAASPTGNVEWDISTVCRAVGESWDAAFNAAQTITDAVGSQNALNDATQASFTATGCAATEDLTIKVSRDGTNDTNNDLAKMLYAEIILRVDM